MTNTAQHYPDINIDQITGADDNSLPVYFKYDGQMQPQRAYIYMDDAGVISADYNGDIGNGVAADVFNDRTLTFGIDALLSGGDIKALVNDNIELFATIHAGHVV